LLKSIFAIAYLTSFHKFDENFVHVQI